MASRTGAARGNATCVSSATTDFVNDGHSCRPWAPGARVDADLRGSGRHVNIDYSDILPGDDAPDPLDPGAQKPVAAPAPAPPRSGFHQRDRHARGTEPARHAHERRERRHPFGRPDPHRPAARRSRRASPRLARRRRDARGGPHGRLGQRGAPDRFRARRPRHPDPRHPGAPAVPGPRDHRRGPARRRARACPARLRGRHLPLPAQARLGRAHPQFRRCDPAPRERHGPHGHAAAQVQEPALRRNRRAARTLAAVQAEPGRRFHPPLGTQEPPARPHRADRLGHRGLGAVEPHGLRRGCRPPRRPRSWTLPRRCASRSYWTPPGSRSRRAR